MPLINISWSNALAVAALACALTTSMIASTATIVQWRLDALQYQLAERMARFEREMSGVTKRLDRLEVR